MPRINAPPPAADQDHVDRKYVTALARGLAILGEFESETSLGNREIALRTGLSPATVTRLTYTLLQLGYLRQLPNGKYCAGAGFLGLSASVQRSLGVQRVARPHMEALARELDCTVALGTRDRNSMVFLEVARPKRAGLTVNTDPGSRLPIHGTAMGMAYLVAAPVEERARVLQLVRAECQAARQAVDRDEPSADWDAVRHAIEEAHRQYARDGFVTWLGSWHRDVNAVGVPLSIDRLQNVYSLICAGSSRSISRRALREVHGPRLVQMVASLREEIEQRPPRLDQPRRG